MPKLWPPRRRAVLLTLFILLFLPLSNFVIVPHIYEQRSLHRAQKAFAVQKALLLAPLQDLGIAGEPKMQQYCSASESTTITMTEVCMAFVNLPYNGNQVSDQTIANYPTQAAKLDKILKDNGWTADHQEAGAPKSLVEIDPHTMGDRAGGSLPMHKNIGSVSCNLVVDYLGIQNAFMVDTLNINEFSCSETITHTMLNFSGDRHYGV